MDSLKAELVEHAMEYAVDKRMYKLQKIQKVMLSFCYRNIQEQTECNDIERRKAQRKLWTQAIIIIKMYSLTLADLIDDMVLTINWINRQQLRMQSEDYLLKEQEWLHKKLNQYYEDRTHAGEALLKVAYLLRSLKIKLTRLEIINTLSLSKMKWDKHVLICKDKKENERDIFNVLILSSVGPKQMTYQIMDAAIQGVLDNKQTRSKVVWNANTIFKGLI